MEIGKRKVVTSFVFPLCEKDLSTMSLAEKTNLKLFMLLKMCTVWLVITSSCRFLSVEIN